MAEVAVTCVKCGIQHTLTGTDWEVEVEVEVWQKEHERAAHDRETVSAWKIERA